MKSLVTGLKLIGAAVVAGLMTMGAANADGALSVAGAGGSVAHIMPTTALAAELAAQGKVRTASTPVTYHSGGRIMRRVNIYLIFWAPAHLQNGGATSMPGTYQAVIKNMVAAYNGHEISTINTQYYEIIGRSIFYHSGQGSYAGSYVDTAAYPARTCTDSFTPGNCLTDAQIRSEVQKVRGIKGWGQGFDKIFMVFTSSGMGSCFSPSSCAYTHYCAYHSYFGSATNPIIYSNEPYGNNSVCSGAPATPPNVGTSDAAATAARHEISEATSDPLLNAWYDSGTGEETSDKCAYQYGTLSWSFSGGVYHANYAWNGHPFLLQEEYDLHHHACVLYGGP